jgi:hypothetical protein
MAQTGLIEKAAALGIAALDRSGSRLSIASAGLARKFCSQGGLRPRAFSTAAQPPSC